MPTPEKQFNRSLLWPRAPFTPKFANGVTPGLRKSQFGSHPEVGILDSGALIVKDGMWKMFLSGSWINFEKANIGHLALANLFSRFGPGCSEGGFLFNGHGDTQVPPAWQLKFGREPTAMEVADACHNPVLAVQIGLGTGQGGTQPINSPTPPSVISISHSLSPLSIRVEELRTSLISIPNLPFIHLLTNNTSWAIIKPWTVEVLRTYRLHRKSLGDTREIPKEN